MKDSDTPNYNNPNYVPKNRIPVRMVLADGSQTVGVVFVRQGERVTEVLSKESMFFPLVSNNGTSLINKNHVIKIEIPTMEDIKSTEDIFPGINMKYLANNNW